MIVLLGLIGMRIAMEQSIPMRCVRSIRMASRGTAAIMLVVSKVVRLASMRLILVAPRREQVILHQTVRVGVTKMMRMMRMIIINKQRPCHVTTQAAAR